MSDITIDLSNNQMEIHRLKAEPWKVTLVDTGLDTMTGGRLKRVKPYLSKTEPFCLTYGDGVSDIDIGELINFHHQHGLDATITAAYPPGRFGAMDIQENNLVSSFKEKPKGDGGMINAGFFVLSPQVIDLVQGDHVFLEREPLERLAENRQLAAFQHTGFWQPMDTLRDKSHLEELWDTGKAPWKVWQ
jgi:glucose-1-phosphate cytidylyltransferase